MGTTHSVYLLFVLALFLLCAESQSHETARQLQASGGSAISPFASDANCNLDVCFVVDQSCSMPKGAALTFIKNVINELVKDDNVVAHYSAFGFVENSQLEQKRISNKNSFFSTLDSSSVNEFNSFQDALTACIDEVKGNKQNIFVISDGFKSLLPPSMAFAFSGKAPELEFNLFSIAVGSPANEQYLKNLASKPNYYSKVDVSALEGLSLAKKYVDFFICPKSCPINHVCFAVDQSGSIRPSDWTKEKNFVTDIAVEISNPFVQTRYSAIKFDHNVQTIQAPTTVLGLFTSKVLQASQNRGGTNVNLGLTACYNLIKSATGTKSIILMTDGYGGRVTIDDRIKQDGISLVAIGIGNNVNANLLKDIVSEPSEDFYIPASFANLEAQVAKVAATTCLLPKFTPAASAGVAGAASADLGGAALALGAAAGAAPSATDNQFVVCADGENC